MKRILIIITILIYTNLNAMLVGSGFEKENIKVLNEFDLKTSYILDYEFQRYFTKFKRYNKGNYNYSFKKAQLYIPEIKKILTQNKIPASFLFLAMAESNFDLQARSHKNAIGIWQFIPQTAINNGLKINYYTDERMDVLKSTKAAAKHLNRLYKIFGKWYLAAIAYNCGEGRVIEAITRATLDMYCENNSCRKNKTIKSYRKVIKDYQRKRVSFDKFYSIYKKIRKFPYKPDIDELLIVQDKLDRQYLPKESRIYIRKIITLAMMNNKKYLTKSEGNYLLNSGIATTISKVNVKGGILLKNIADVIGVSKKYLKSLNPHIIKNITPPERKRYEIYIPYTYLAKFNKNIKNIKPNAFEVHVVKKGDTLGQIASFYGTKYTIIKKFNDLTSNTLRLKQELIIPVDPDTYKKPIKYIVKSGDSLGKIASKFGIKYGIIKKYNNLKSNSLKIKQALMIPRDKKYIKSLAKNKKTKKQKIKYIVKSGDSLGKIASKFGIGYGIIKKLNNLKSNNLKINQELIIPRDKKYIKSLAKNKKTKKQKIKYIVKSGDSLGKIASKFGIGYGIIKKLNNLKSNNLKINQVLIIPVNSKVSKNYIVKKGDTLHDIAKKFDVSLKKVMEDNYLTTAMINIGDKIVINFN